MGKERCLRELQPIHYQVMALRLSGMSYSDISEAIGVPQATIKNWFYKDILFSEAYKAAKAEAIERAKEVLQQAGPAAAQKIVELMNHDSGAVALAAAKEVLDRIGLKSPERHEVAVASGIVVKWEDGEPADVG